MGSNRESFDRSMNESGDYDGTVYEIGYTEAQSLLNAELDEIATVARDQLGENYDRKGDGWQKEEPRYHMWKGIDELFSATHYVDEGNLERFEARLADGMNHFLMASYLAQIRGEDDGTE